MPLKGEAKRLYMRAYMRRYLPTYRSYHHRKDKTNTLIDDDGDKTPCLPASYRQEERLREENPEDELTPRESRRRFWAYVKDLKRRLNGEETSPSPQGVEGESKAVRCRTEYMAYLNARGYTLETFIHPRDGKPAYRMVPLSRP